MNHNAYVDDYYGEIELPDEDLEDEFEVRPHEEKVQHLDFTNMARELPNR